MVRGEDGAEGGCGRVAVVGGRRRGRCGGRRRGMREARGINCDDMAFACLYALALRDFFVFYVLL